MNTLMLYDLYGPIITDEESNDLLKSIQEILDTHPSAVVDFSRIVAMTTKSAKKVFGELYLKLNQDEFYRKINIKSASATIKEIIYDAILNSIKNHPLIT